MNRSLFNIKDPLRLRGTLLSLRETSRLICSIAISMLCSCSTAKNITLIKDGHTAYVIVIPANATKQESQSAGILQQYLHDMSGVNLAIITDQQPAAATEISVGNTNRIPENIPVRSIPDNGFLLTHDQQKIFIIGGGRRGVLNAVYTLIDKYFGCRKYSSEAAFIPKQEIVTLPDDLHDLQQPVFSFRQAYFPDAMNAAYMDWHKLNDLYDFWGLWGHSFFKLVPPEQYFTAHPEYFALVNGKRQPTQLCLSNEAVVKAAVTALKERMAKNPDALYWSVSQNDNAGFCTCDQCRKLNAAEGGPQGSLIAFVNKVAAAFPDKIITTLAYGPTQHAPLHIRPAKNVAVMLSDIDCDRSQPIATNPRSAGFRKDLSDWSAICPDMMIWDYLVQFTNYISPFPNLRTLAPNMKFFAANRVKAVFAQGSGEDQSAFGALRCYMTARLLWDPGADGDSILNDFLEGYYGAGGKYIREYIDLMQQELIRSGKVLDIYGNPVSASDTWLNPVLITRYGALFDEAEKVTESDPVRYKRVVWARQPLEFAVLQEARFFGTDQYGMFVKDEDEHDQWIPKPGLADRIHRFVATCQENGVKHLSEDGLTPEQYEKEWMDILHKGIEENLALKKQVTILTASNEDYPAKGAATLTDGIRGGEDYAYNWLGWYGNDMQVLVDLDRIQDIRSVSVGFLSDQRHGIFVPQQVKVEISSDNKNFSDAGTATSSLQEEYAVQTKNMKVELPAPAAARYVHITAVNLRAMPQWIARGNKRPFIFSDEIIIH